jgi:hypothetical protein
MSNNGRPTTKDYVDMAVNGTREVFKQELLILKNNILDTVDKKIITHDSDCEDKRAKEKETIVLSKKQLFGIVTAIFSSGTIGMVAQYLYRLISG